jgi:hypothetical protein
MPERDWSAFACPNPNCSLYRQAGGANIRPHGWSSKQHRQPVETVAEEHAQEGQNGRQRLGGMVLNERVAAVDTEE